MEKSSETNNKTKALSKSELRKTVLQKRNELSKEEHTRYSKLINNRIKEWSVYKECDTLLVYVSFRSEVDTYGIIMDALESGKKVYCPKVFGDDMLFYQINSLDDLASGYMGIMEPKDGLKVLDSTTDKILMLMPGSVFDKDGNRIGYGKGFYDHFLLDSKNKGLELITTALAFSLQIVESIPTEEHDYKVDYIVTENEIVGF